MSQSSLAKGKENLAKTAISRQRPGWSLQIALAFGIVGAIAYTCTPPLAQITPDATLGAENSIVTPNANVGGFPADLIQGGATRGTNLFHSFQEFNIGAGQRVYFANPAGIENILTRVTGNNLSNILGTLGVTGRADLFLLNPNGILFGPNARLDVGGSFFATTANAVQFGDRGFFSSTNPEAPGLLTVKPSAFFFNQLNAGTIVNQSVARNPVVPAFIEGLRVPNGENLVLLGGNISIDGGHLNVFGGRVEIGAVAGTGTVGLNVDGSLSFPTDLSRADVSLFNSLIGVAARDSGSVTINARNLNISGNSLIRAGILSGFGTLDSQAGDITLNATETLQIRGEQSRILNLVFEDAIGNSGDIRITAGSLFLTDGARLDASTFGQGNGGNVIIEARERVSLDGESVILGPLTSIRSTVGETGNGAGGDIRITAGSVYITNAARLNTSTNGRGDAGNVIIQAREAVSFEGESVDGEFTSAAFSRVNEGAIGNGGNIEITSGSLLVSNGSQLDAATFGQGNGGNVIISVRDAVNFTGSNSSGSLSSIAFSNVETAAVGSGGNVEIIAGSLSVTKGAQLQTQTEGQGNAGSVIINVRDHVVFDGNDTAAISQVAEGAVGRGGNVEITAGSLSITNEAALLASTEGQGNAGDVIIEARDQVSLDNGASITSTVGETGNSDGGNIRISTGWLIAANGALLNTSTFGQGNAGDIFIEARDAVSFTGTSRDDQFPSSAFSGVGRTGNGDGGDIHIRTEVLSATNGTQLITTTFGQGSAGDIIITARDRIFLDYAAIFSTVGFPDAGIGNGDGGDIHITTGALSVTNSGQLSTSTFGQGDAGNIIIEALDSVSFTGIGRDSRLATAAFSIVGETGNGNGGDIHLSTNTLSVADGGRLTVSTNGQGNAGNIQIDARDSVLLDGVNNKTGFVSGLFSSTIEEAEGRGGTITVNTDSFRIINGAVVDAQTFGTFRGGDVAINTRNLSLNNRAQISASSQGTGQAGGVAITATEAVTLTNSGITTSAEQASGGAIAITTESLSLNRGRITAATGTSGAQGAANITLQGLDLLLMGNESLISANALNQANGGNVAIDSTLIVATPPTGQRGSDITANAFEGNGGRVTINTQGLFGIEFRPELTPDNDITVSSIFGLSGEFALNSPDIDPSRGLYQLPTNLIDASQQIDRRCTPGEEARNSSFTITGRGGLPPSPNDVLQGETVVTSWVSLDAEVENNIPPVPTTPTSSVPRKLVEAQGWVINEKGEVVLTASAPRLTPTESGFFRLECPASQK